jgi:hypothetical protein
MPAPAVDLIVPKFVTLIAAKPSIALETPVAGESEGT